MESIRTKLVITKRCRPPPTGGHRAPSRTNFSSLLARRIHVRPRPARTAIERELSDRVNTVEATALEGRRAGSFVVRLRIANRRFYSNPIMRHTGTLSIAAITVQTA
jgi:hypothetical protein